MSAKWRAIQHRHRYTYSAVVFPPHFIQALNQTPYESAFFAELRRLVSLSSTYAQLEHVKNLAIAFSNLLSDQNSEENAVSCAVKLYLEILFLENSLPLHKTLASGLCKCKNFRSSIEDCFRKLCEDYGGEKNVINGKRFCVSRAALSMMSTPKLGYLVQVVDQCAVLVGLDVVSGLHSVVQETNESSRPSPIVMEQCQEALSCMYYLLQRFPDKFSSAGCEHHGVSLNDQSVLEMTLMNVLSILKSEAFSRDCFVAAGVSFCAALQVCLTPDELGLFIMRGIFNQHNIQEGKIDLNTVVGKIPIKVNLIDEIHDFSALSRLWLIRGILTAVSRTVLATHYVVFNGCMESGDHGYTVKTILYDAILPELCIYAENPRDSHSNFHSLTVMQICLQQIKTLLRGDTGGVADNYDPIPVEMGARILKTVWNNLEDPLSQTVKQVHLIFDLYLDIQSSLQWAEGSEQIKLFLRKIASDLLCLGPRCKGRYIPLASLTRRLGAKTILDMNPDLLFETTKAYIDDDVCCAATTFLKCFLECLRDEYWASDGVDSGYTKYRGHCLLPILCGLAFGLAKLRSNLNTYALPVLLELDVDSIFSMLALIGIGWDEGPLFAYAEISNADMTLGLEQQIAVLVSLLKVSRVLALMEGDIDWYEHSSISSEGADLVLENCNIHCVVTIKGVDVNLPVKWLMLALTHIDESLRMDAAETLFLNPKTASLPSSLELSLMRRAIPLNMRCCSTAFQMKWNSLFRKFFSRVKTALERQHKLGTWKPFVPGVANEVNSITVANKTVKHRAEYLFDFTNWLSQFLFFSCYPSAPYERKIMAMELILIMLNVWPVPPTSVGNRDAFFSENNHCPYSKGFTLPDSTLLLVGSIIDSWDRLRESSFRILLYFPTPLPGISSSDLVVGAIIWAKKLICSPRVRESDAGALALRLLFRKYVLELRWVVQPSCNICSESELPNEAYQSCASTSPIVSYITSLIDWLLAAVENAEKNLLAACKNSFVHGILLTLRYTFEELDWNSAMIMHSTVEMKQVFERLLELVMRITSLALWVVSADGWYLPDDMEEMVDDEAFRMEIPNETDSCTPESQIEVKAAKVEEEIRPSEQIVMVGCWLAMKEVSLLLGTVIRKVPLPTSDDMTKAVSDAAEESILPSDAMLDIQQLETIGNHFLEVLLKMKHNGAIDKTRAGFTALCNRLLCSNDPRLCQLTESWMERLMERTAAKGQTVDDLLRRSAGIPAAFIAFFLSEPEGTPKRLLPRALSWLISVVSKSLTDLPKGNSSNSNLCSGSSNTTGCTQPPGVNGTKGMSKFRDEGVVPTVHAFNVLRAAFNDTNLATDVSGFSAEALIISIRSFSSTYWEVRNSACLAYTALVRRMIGFLNIQKRESARRALTGLEFFHRYPTLHSFLLNELKVATELLPEVSSDELGSNLKNVVHPSLCPILILLSRLKPSPISSETGDTLDPFLFVPFIRRCSIQSNFRIRVLASRAVTGLVANEKLQVVMLNFASELPSGRSHVMNPDSSSTLNSTDGTSCSFNSIHGMLLQLNSLVDINCRNLSDSSKKDIILHEFVQTLSMCSWIGRPRQCPCPILNGCILKILNNMLSIARTCEASRSADVIWNLLWELSSECLDLEPAGCPSYFDPTIQELRKQAAMSYFDCVFETSKITVEDELPRNFSSPASSSSRVVGIEAAFNGFPERLIRSMSDASYEVRLASLKWLFWFLKRGESSDYNCGDQLYFEVMRICSTSINIQDTLVKLLDSEKHHKCMCYLLKILFTWNSLEFKDDQSSLEPRYVHNMDSHSIFELWNKLVSLFKITRHAKTRQTLICCLGMCAKQISSLYMSFTSFEVEMRKAKTISTDQSKMLSGFYDALSYFVDLIEQSSDASEPVTMRRAAAESMIASGMLSHAEILGPLVSYHFKPDEAIRLYARKVLDLWFTCIKLLEDEDFGLRKRLALDVQKCFPSKKAEKAMATSQVEKVIELCFEHLSTTFGHWIDYLDHLCCWVSNAATNANYNASEGDLVRCVFDKEIDNYHEEKLLICQMCCSHLETIIISKSRPGDSWIESGIRDLLHKWRTKFLEQLIAFTHDHLEKRGKVDWIGGVGNHKDAFLPIYANLVAFYTLSNCILKEEPENSECMLSEVSALGEAINPFLRNPLISSLYLIVVQSHERYLGGSAENLTLKWRDYDSTWGEFCPYFLLR